MGAPKQVTAMTTIVKKRYRACETCHNLKIKCEPSTNDEGCERCARLSLECTPAARRWQRDRIAELEAHVKELQGRLNTASESPGSNLSTQGSGGGDDATRAGSMVSPTNEGSIFSMSTTTLPPTSEEIGVLDGLLDWQGQRRCLDTYVSTAGEFWPVIRREGSTSAWLQTLRNDMPLALMSIIAFTIPCDIAKLEPQEQESLRKTVLETLGKAAVGLKNPSLDLIQSTLIACFWVRPSVEGNHGNSNQLVALARDLSVELGFGAPTVEPSPQVFFFRHFGPLTLSIRHTWLAQWALCTLNAINLRRPFNFGWDSSHFEALAELEADGSYPLFVEILHTIRVHARVAHSLQLCDIHAYRDISSTAAISIRDEVYLARDELLSRPLAHDPQLRYWRTIALIHVYEPVLHTPTNKSLFRSPFLAGNIGVDDFAHPSVVTPHAQLALWGLAEACHEAIELIAGMDPTFILYMPSGCFSTTIGYTFSILVKLYVAVSAPGNTYGSVMSRENVHLREAMTSLIEVKQSLMKLDPQMWNWNTRIIGSVEWLEPWLNDYESILYQYEANLAREAAQKAIGGLQPMGFF